MTNPLNQYNQLLESGSNLSPDQIPTIANLLIDEAVEANSKCAFLKTLSKKGETNQEFCKNAYLNR